MVQSWQGMGCFWSLHIKQFRALADSREGGKSTADGFGRPSSDRSGCGLGVGLVAPPLGTECRAKVPLAKWSAANRPAQAFVCLISCKDKRGGEMGAVKRIQANVQPPVDLKASGWGRRGKQGLLPPVFNRVATSKPRHACQLLLRQGHNVSRECRDSRRWHPQRC